MRLVTLFLVSLSASAFAADAPREIDFTQVLKGPTGEDLTNCARFDDAGKVCVKQEAVTLGDASAVALEAMTDKDRSIDPKIKFDRDLLARKVYKNAHAVLTVDEIKMVKDRIGDVYGPAQVGAAWPLLDPTLGK